MKNTHVVIKLKEPERWYMKFTERRKHYFQFHTSRWGDSVFLALSNDSKVYFNWLLSQFLMHNKGVLSVCLDTSCVLLNISLDDCKQCLNELNNNDFIELQTLVRKSRKLQLKEEKRKEKKRIEAKRISNNDKSLSGTHILNSVLELWNSKCESANMPSVKILNNSRKTRLIKACKIYNNIEDWKKIFNITATKGFTGQDGREFVPNWDYIFRNENYIKFHEEYLLNEKELKTTTPENINLEFEKSMGLHS